MARSDTKTWLYLLTGAVVILFLMSAGYLQLGIAGPDGGQDEGTPESELVSVNKPILFAVTDPLAGSAIGEASIAIYDDDVLVESLTTDATKGTVTTALPYMSDTVLNVKISKSGYVTRWCEVVVPKMSPVDAEALSTNFVSLQTVNLGTFTIKATDQLGNMYSSGDTINFTSLGVSSVSLNMMITNTEDDSGYISSYDPINGIHLKAVMVASTTGSDVVVNGAGSHITRGTTSYWLSEINDDDLTKNLVGSTYESSGIATKSITIGKGALGSGETQVVTFALYVYFDPAYFAQNGVGGPDATVVATFSITLAA